MVNGAGKMGFLLRTFVRAFLPNGGPRGKASQLKILFLDIETSPTTAYVWGLWQQNVGLNQIIDSGAVLCWAAKWAGQEGVKFSSTYKTGTKKMLEGVHKLLEEADIVVHYNGSRYDIPILNREFVSSGMSPPAPYKQIDLLKVARNRFRFISNKLDYVANALGLGQKIRHKGFELWIECMKNDPEAWKAMKEYNIQDVLLLEKLYDKFKPWIKTSVHIEGLVCPACGGSHYQSRGTYRSKLLVYQRFQCKCGKWFRSNKTITPKGQERYVGID